LFVEGPTDKSFRLVYSDTPNLSSGNSMELVDWPPDGMHVLVEVSDWEYESEGTYTEFLSFSPNSGSVRKPDLMQILATKFGKGCWSENSITGYTPQGDIVVTVGPNIDITGIINGAKSCVNRKTLIALDPEGDLRNIALLPKSFKVQRYGKLQEPQAY
jgi:hypothetical protein